MDTIEQQANFLSSGCTGLDRILNGGYLTGNSYLIRGGPGTGKTTLGLHFLQEGVDKDEKVLFISLAESTAKIKRNGNRMGFDTDTMEFLDLTPESDVFTGGESSSIFMDAEMDLDPLIQSVTETVKQVMPVRVFVDSLSQFRYLITSDYQFHKQMLGLFQYLLEKAETVLFVSEPSSKSPDDDLQFLSDGVITLERNSTHRFMEVSKLRGYDFLGGAHAYTISGEGINVFPQLLPDRHQRRFEYEKLSFGVPEINEMVHGGLERGCTSLISGPSGVGKTTLGLQFMKEAAGRGERSVIYLFDEKQETLISRCKSIGIPVQDMISQGNLEIFEISPRQTSVDEFNGKIRRQVEARDTRIVMVDSIRGYKLMTGTDHLPEAVHPMVNYFRNMGVSLLLINEVENLTGDFRITDVGISYMSDIVIFLRFIEDRGSMQKAIGVLKNRLSDYEKTLRRFEITSYGVKVGEPLHNMRGILSGAPTFIESSNDKT